MKTSHALLLAAIGAAIALPSIGMAQQKSQVEKCYGVAKAGKNDCETATSSCAGTSKRDAQKDAWVGVPKGTCEKIVGASLTPGK